MGPGDYDKDMLWQGNPLALEWWSQWVASSALGYGPPSHTLVGRGVVPSGQPLVLWVIVLGNTWKYLESLEVCNIKSSWFCSQNTVVLFHPWQWHAVAMGSVLTAYRHLQRYRHELCTAHFQKLVAQQRLHCHLLGDYHGNEGRGCNYKYYTICIISILYYIIILDHIYIYIVYIIII